MSKSDTPNVVGINVLKQNGLDVDELLKELIKKMLQLNLLHTTTLPTSEHIVQAWKEKDSKESLKMQD